MSKHTPGPWRIDEGTLDRVMGADGRKVADAAIAWRDSDTVLANSRLIAAAPDLLAALEKARAQVVGFSTDRIGAETAVRLVSYIDAAIAKAKGDA